MIYWLTQTLAAHPALARAEAPEGLLNTEEQVRYRSLVVEKRRRDWVLGRWTAKHLVAAHLESATGRRPALSDIAITADPDGAPRVTITGASASFGDLALSISHSRDRAFCALTAIPGCAPGADIEYVEDRDPSFVAEFFANAEIRMISGAPAPLQTLLVTAIWSAKEAVLKALHHGLTVDTRNIVCLPSDPIDNAWVPIRITCDSSLTGATFRGWWRALDGFALTLAVNEDLTAGQTIASNMGQEQAYNGVHR